MCTGNITSIFILQRGEFRETFHKVNCLQYFIIKVENRIASSLYSCIYLRRRAHIIWKEPFTKCWLYFLKLILPDYKKSCHHKSGYNALAADRIFFLNFHQNSQYTNLLPFTKMQKLQTCFPQLLIALSAADSVFLVSALFTLITRYHHQ